MPRTISLVPACVFLCTLVSSMAQEAPPPARAPVLPEQPKQAAQPAPPPKGEMRLEEQILVQVLANPNLDAAQVLPLLMVLRRGEMDGDALIPLLLLKGMAGSGPRPVLVRDGDTLLVVHRGVVQKVKAGTLEVAGSLNYRKAGATGAADLKALLTPLLGERKLGENEQRLLELLADPDAGMEQMLPLLMMMGGGQGDGGEAMGVLLLSRLSSGLGETQPVVELEGGTLFVLDRGVLYKINLGKMELEGRLDCRKGTSPDQEALAAALGPAIAQAREAAQQEACSSNLKQMGLGVHMYAQDHEEKLPGTTWVKDIWNYVGNPDIFRCPERPEQGVGYAINAAVLNKPMAEIANPSETVLFFETNLGGDNPVGGAKDIPAEGVHNGGINVGFVDGHVKWWGVEEAKQLLEQGE